MALPSLRQSKTGSLDCLNITKNRQFENTFIPDMPHNFNTCTILLYLTRFPNMKHFWFIVCLFHLSATQAQDYSLDWAYSVHGSKGFGSSGCFSGSDASNNLYVSGYNPDMNEFSYWPDSSYVFEDVNDSILTSSLSATYIRKMNQQGTPLWVRYFKRPVSSIPQMYIEDMDVAPDGTVAITGYIDGTIDFDPGPDTLIVSTEAEVFYVVVLDSLGNLLWKRTAIHPNEQASFGRTVSIDNNGEVYCGVSNGEPAYYGDDGDEQGYISENTSSWMEDVAIIKYSATGDLLWVNHYVDGAKTIFNCSDTDSENNLIVAGHIHEGYTDTLDFDLGPEEHFATGFFQPRTLNDAFILKINPEGEYVWVRGLSEGSVDEFDRWRQSIVDIQVDSDDNLVMIGKTQNDPVLSPAPFDSLHFDRPSSLFRRMHYVMKLKSDGDLLWARGIAMSPSVDQFQDLAVTPDNRIYTIGPEGTASSLNHIIDIGDNPNLISTQQQYLDGSGILLSFSPQGELLWYEAIDVDLTGYEMDHHFNDYHSPSYGLTPSADGSLFYVTHTTKIPAFNVGIQEEFNLPTDYESGYENAWALYARYIPCHQDNSQEMLACNTYTWPVNGETYTEPGTYYYYNDIDTVYCDPVYFLDLELYDYSLEVIQQGDSLIADAEAGSVQWFTCADSIYEAIPTATGLSFTPWNSGFYSAQYSTHGCTYMSDCFYYEAPQVLSVPEGYSRADFKIYPNPTDGILNIEMPKGIESGIIEIRSLLGTVLYSRNITSSKITIRELDLANGVYLCSLIASDGLRKHSRKFQFVK